MMTNLFSVFDPATGMLSMNWLSMMFPCLLPIPFWNTPNKIMTIISMMNKKLVNEIINQTNKTDSSLIFISIFMFILIGNLMGLLPYIYTSSAQLSFSLSIALTLWMSMMLYGWINKTNSMFMHLVPVGTPSVLMPFMVMIESISNLIRPGSLAVRLSANMIAGHLLMSLLGNSMTQNSSLMLIMMWMFLTLMMFELAVAFIQSYVFMTLSTLYSSEI